MTPTCSHSVLKDGEGIITLTKQTAMGSQTAASDYADAGAPNSPIERDQNVLLRSDPPLGSFGAALPVGRASRHALDLEPVVRVSVLGRLLELPMHALGAGLSDLRLATEARAGLEDYARGVGLVLGALEARGILVFRQ